MNIQNNPTSILASYIVYKSLYTSNNYGTPYEVIACFIKFIINDETLREFSIYEMKDLLYRQFGFQLPDAIIKISLSTMKENVKKENGRYIVTKYDHKNINFSNYILSEIEKTKILMENLIYYAKENNPKMNIDTNLLIETFIKYMLDKSVGNSPYTNIISSFIIKKSIDKNIKEQLDSIRIGSLLYLGLNYNVDSNKNFDKLTIFLDTEILFDIVGYNGIIYSDLAQDMLRLIQKANTKKQKIFIKYFKETKQECDEFFLAAENLVNKTKIIEKVAMTSILENCKDISDVIDKQSDFYRKLQYTYSIMEDAENSYYYDDKNQYNLEEMTIDETIDGCDNLEDSIKNQKSLKFISHINKLRKGEKFDDYAKSKYIFITRTRNTIKISNLVTQKLNISDAKLAISMNFFTNWLWYKINRGFGAKDFPKSIDILIKAKIILSNFISDEVLKLYDEYHEQYKLGKLTKETLIFRTMALREKNIKPENISISNIDDELNFENEFINRYREERDRHKTQLNLQNEEIKELIKEKELNFTIIEKLKDEKKRDYCKKYYEIKNLINTITKKQSELDKIEQQKLKKEEKQKRIQLIKTKIIKFLGTSFFLIVTLYIIHSISKYLFPEETNIPNIITIISGIFPIFVYLYKVNLKEIWKNIKNFFDRQIDE